MVAAELAWVLTLMDLRDLSTLDNFFAVAGKMQAGKYVLCEWII